jgi:hypothetical protein
MSTVAPATGDLRHFGEAVFSKIVSAEMYPFGAVKWNGDIATAEEAIAYYDLYLHDFTGVYCTGDTATTIEQLREMLDGYTQRKRYAPGAMPKQTRESIERILYAILHSIPIRACELSFIEVKNSASTIKSFRRVFLSRFSDKDEEMLFQVWR